MLKIKRQKFEIIGDETVFLSPCDQKETIRRFRQLSNHSEKFTDGTLIYYKCSKKGKISVENFSCRNHYRPRRFLYMRGQFESENGKGILRVHEVYSKIRLANRIINMCLIPFGILLLVSYFAINILVALNVGMDFLTKNYKYIGILLALISITISAFFCYRYYRDIKTEIKNKNSDFEIVKNSLAGIFEKIRRWDD